MDCCSLGFYAPRQYRSYRGVGKESDNQKPHAPHYEYSDHEAEKYHFVKSLYLSDITALQFRLERTLFRQSFYMTAFTEFKALDIGTASWLGLLNLFGKSRHLEPGPDALEFIQQISGLLAARKHQLDSASNQIPV